VGIIYGIWFGPFLGIQPLFYVGWVLLPVALFFLFSIVIYFPREGKPGEGKGLMDTTVLVDSGTYAIVRHPMALGSILLMSASILISQHWLVAIVGVIVSALSYRTQVKLEKGLLVKFGDDYKRYMEKVPRMNLFLGILRFVKRRREN
jgi:protein-S-isoprenylcysteine O-methyltransferase Ste14